MTPTHIHTCAHTHIGYDTYTYRHLRTYTYTPTCIYTRTYIHIHIYAPNPTRTRKGWVWGQSHPSTPRIGPTLRVLDGVFEVARATIVTLRCQAFAHDTPHIHIHIYAPPASHPRLAHIHTYAHTLYISNTDMALAHIHTSMIGKDYQC